MVITKKPTTWTASDGKEFDTEAKAVKHDEVVTAINNFEQAKKRLGFVLAESTKTADGHPFTFDRWSYWTVKDWGMDGPTMRRVRVSRWDAVVIGDNYDSDAQIVEEIGEYPHKQTVHHCVKDLYANEGNAKKALIDAIKQYISRKQKEVKELEKTL